VLPPEPPSHCCFTCGIKFQYCFDSNGDPILFDTSSITWDNAATPKFCFYKNTTNSDSIIKYGALYNWHVVNPANSKKIAPTGWHVPSDSEWDTLQSFLIAQGYNWDGTMTDNKIAKSLAAKTDWQACTTAGTIGCDLTRNNAIGFSALPGCTRDNKGNFNLPGGHGYRWSATESVASGAWYRSLHFGHDYLDKHSYGGIFESCGFSIRLVQDR
jgi:uncharacterized protein (TIGR02145 family)